MYAVAIHALETVFTLSIPNVLQFLEPLWSAVESTLRYYGKRGNHAPITNVLSTHFPSYSSPTITSIIEVHKIILCFSTSRIAGSIFKPRSIVLQHDAMFYYRVYLLSSRSSGCSSSSCRIFTIPSYFTQFASFVS